MFQHLLVPVDGTDLSERAARAALELAAKLGAAVTAFVVEPLPPLPHMGTNPTLYQRESDEHNLATEEHANSLLKRVGDMARELGVTCRGQFRRTDRIDDAIAEAAAESGCDLIVMATHGRHGLDALIHGSLTKSVLAHSQLPLLILH